MANTVAGTHLSGNHASRPAGNAVPDGTLYSCTTHSLIYVSNYAGNSWSTWANLAGTGSVATDAIWDAAGDLAVGSGADTATKLAKGSAGAVLAMGNGSLIWNAGTSFPGSKATNDRYFRTDIGEEYYWDGTRWASLEVKVVPFPLATDPPITANGTVLHRMAIPPGGNSDILLAGVYGAFYVAGGTALSGSHKWVGTVSKTNTAGASSLGSTSIDSGSSDQWRPLTAVTINAVAAVGSGYVALEVNWAKTGTPGSLYANLMLVYRTVST